MTNDGRKMVDYICRRIAWGPTRVVLIDGRDGIIADLIPRLGENGYVELEIESNYPEWVTLAEVYDHFRQQDMTSREWSQRFVSHRLRLEYEGKVAALSVTERELFDAASEVAPTRGEKLTEAAGHDWNGHTKCCLAHLVKLGLLTKRSGYMRIPRPNL